MKQVISIVALMVIASVTLGNLRRLGAAQNPLATPGYWTVPTTVLHTNCPVPATGATAYCFAGDGFWVSINGAAYLQVGSAGVSSVNGKTGTVVLGASTMVTAPPVSTANGAITIGAPTATTTIQ